MLRLETIPDVLVVIGAGVIGIEFASMFAALGTRVTVVDGRQELLDFCDHEVTEALRYHLRDLNVVFRFGERVTRVQETRARHADDARERQADPGRRGLLLGRPGRAPPGRSTSRPPGLEPAKRGLIEVNERFQTAVPHIYAVGDVIGFPSLAATSAEQGRLAACHAFGIETKTMRDLLPFGIYSIPEISYVGRTEHELTAEGMPYEVGIAHYRELARGHILGESHGMVKLLVAPEDRILLGVHAIGTGATEVVHIGQAVMGLGGTVDYLVDTVFNYPTLAEAYKVAALDAANKLRAVSLHLGVI